MMAIETLPEPVALEGMRALIVGGTSGIGLETARQLVAAGAGHVVVAGRDPERGARALARLGDPPTVSLLIGDAGTPEGAQALVDGAVERLGAIDLLVCSTAPAVLPELFHRTPADTIAASLAQLALPPMLLAAAVLPHMRARRSGVIVNVASDAGKSATPGEAVIGAGMAAIIMFSRTIAMEAKRDGVRVNVLTPSLVAGTETSDRILAGGFSQKLFEKAATMASLGVAEAADVAATIVFLASPAARRLTGQAISVNGGISAA
jgi:NAD(P)-dependent dehydrogenase (short-subunit alcohol dehydrogenase family)